VKRRVSNAVVALLVAYALGAMVSVASALWSTPGSFGLGSDYRATVRDVVPGGPADRAGIAAGDRVVLLAMPFADRRYLSGSGAPVRAGTTVHVVTEHGGVTRASALTADPAELSLSDRWTLLVVLLASVMFVVVGAVLIVIRPSAATWGFGLYSLLVLPALSYPFAIPDARLAFGAVLFYDVVQNFGVAGLLLFALTFPRPFDVAWRVRVRQALPALVVVLALMTLYPDLANVVFGLPARVENTILQFTFAAVAALAFATLCDTYRRSVREERERVRWVLVGFGVGLLANFIGNTLLFSTIISTNPPAWLENVLVSFNVLLPLTVAYAVVRHRVLEINFVIGQALIFTALTSALAGVFGILDWLFGRVLENFELSRVLSAAVSICVALTFSRLEHRTLDFVEVLFFRNRRAAEAHIERAIHALPQARTAAVIEAALVNDVAVTLAVASAAVFRRDGAAFQRTASIGWGAGDCALLDDGDPLVLMLRDAPGRIDLDELAWSRRDLPDRGREPHTALPILSHTDLAGFALYGGHPDGTALDPGELGHLERLTTAAGLAFDQLEARALRAENESLRATNAGLTARLDELRRAQRS
jgi:hypothetical protein